ncbi:ABC transporter ATP-binding protein [Arthrobacter sunyaminii]|uniref:ATP-binding cassette domain-containing protein n=1 Tax=Arthrobacter sunyaminii TaxID=2816859 RepID=A0A975S530_9MICC|nr:ATP-binding cassette domain-containing protein [Arthrobacter sunyaminii]MBO0896030.1 ABC transporter ATP-binding protein [Arthrobacter sunyaminii]MBO0907705.1 ABC transporter ATP-binding protein [Arthrobacter sunyaminii]QWQ35261.1 ATP-binding cassette domain-containing protein [Arthrobacter sunyaminii]
MDAVKDLEYLREDPCIVIDEVSMRYRVPSSEAPAADDTSSGTARLLRRVMAKPNLVTVNALNPMSLVAVRGESIGIVGRNGSGKSTLMKLISGQVKPTKGAVYAVSTPVMLGVNAALVPELPGDHNVVLGCLAMGMSKAQIAEKFDEIVELSGLEKAIHLPMRSYSSGMASRLRFAIAASIDPEILLIDEALNTGDAQFADRSKKRMDELRGKAGCVFLVSHSLDTILEMCTRVVWIDKGDLLMDGEPKAVVNAYKDFTRHLSKGNNISAAKIRTDAMESLTVTRVMERSTGRRSMRTH